MLTVAAWGFGALGAIAIAFQLALAAGAPWGAYAMGGRYPGRLPPGLRVGAVIQAGVLALLALVVLARAGLVLVAWHATAAWAVWIAVGVSAISAVLNLITPSAQERRLWAPVGIGMLATSLVVALG